MSSARCRQIVLGIGNAERGDDAAGRAVARLLQGRLPDDVEIAELEGEAMELLARFEGADAAFLVDACWSGAPAGSVRRLDVNVTPLQQGLFSLSTHGFGLAEAVELARALAQLPPYCVVYAIEGATFETGAPLSPAVAAAVADVAGRVQTEIADEDNAKRQEPLSKPC
jgi:hydrogenase maturation protease